MGLILHMAEGKVHQQIPLTLVSLLSSFSLAMLSTQ